MQFHIFGCNLGNTSQQYAATAGIPQFLPGNAKSARKALIDAIAIAISLKLRQKKLRPIKSSPTDSRLPIHEQWDGCRNPPTALVQSCLRLSSGKLKTNVNIWKIHLPRSETALLGIWEIVNYEFFKNIPTSVLSCPDITIKNTHFAHTVTVHWLRALSSVSDWLREAPTPGP